jgi:hypothetical protein
MALLQTGTRFANQGFNRCMPYATYEFYEVMCISNLHTPLFRHERLLCGFPASRKMPGTISCLVEDSDGHR